MFNVMFTIDILHDTGNGMTVPPGTERLRISLSAGLTDAEVDKVLEVFKTLHNN